MCPSVEFATDVLLQPAVFPHLQVVRRLRQLDRVTPPHPSTVRPPMAEKDWERTDADDPLT